MHSICVTGHRPKRLYGYDLSDVRWVRLYYLFKRLLKEKECDIALSGMALGVDTIFAMATLSLRDDDQFPIKLHAAVPCRNLSEPWFNEDDVNRFKHILGVADIVTYVTDSDYVEGCLERRNEFLVDNSDEILAVWTGSPGGTKHCIDYAKKKGKSVTNLINEKGGIIYDRP